MAPNVLPAIGFFIHQPFSLSNLPPFACWRLLAPFCGVAHGSLQSSETPKIRNVSFLNDQASFPPVFKSRVPCCQQQQRRRRSPKPQHIRADLVCSKRFRFLSFHIYASSFCNMRHHQQPLLYFSGGSVRAPLAMVN